MNRKQVFILALTLIFSASEACATVDYLVVNHITKQLYWAETDHPPGWIGWESIPETGYAQEEKRYRKLGYKLTKNPFLIEEIIAWGLLLVVFVFFGKRRVKK
ncbi:MAG: hypothetical protein R3B47_02340 [Bacteroidia bacterium]